MPVSSKWNKLHFYIFFKSVYSCSTTCNLTSRAASISGRLKMLFVAQKPSWHSLSSGVTKKCICVWWQHGRVSAAKRLKKTGFNMAEGGLLLSESFFQSLEKHESLGGRVLYTTEMQCGYRTILQHKQIWGFTQLSKGASFSWCESINNFVKLLLSIFWNSDVPEPTFSFFCLYFVY